LGRQAPRREVLLEELVREQHLVVRRVLVEHAEVAPDAQHVVGRGVRQPRDGLADRHAHLPRVGRRPAALHGFGQGGEVRQEPAALRQGIGRGPPVSLDDLEPVALGEQVVRQQPWVVAFQLALQSLADKRGEERDAPGRGLARLGDLVEHEPQEEREPEELESARAGQVLPKCVGLVGMLEGQEAPDLLVAERLEADLRHAQVGCRQRRAVVEAAAGEDGAVARAGCDALDQELLPAGDAGAVVGGARRRHLVEAVEEQRHAAGVEQLVERGQVRETVAPLLGQPSAGGRRVGGGGGAVEAQGDEEGPRARLTLPTERRDGGIELEAPQQRALAAAGGAQEHERGLGGGREEVGERREPLGMRLPARGGGGFAAVDEQRQGDETGVQSITRLGPLGDAAEVVRGPVGRRLQGDGAGLLGGEDDGAGVVAHGGEEVGDGAGEDGVGRRGGGTRGTGRGRGRLLDEDAIGGREAGQPAGLPDRLVLQVPEGRGEQGEPAGEAAAEVAVGILEAGFGASGDVPRLEAEAGGEAVVQAAPGFEILVVLLEVAPEQRLLLDAGERRGRPRRVGLLAAELEEVGADEVVE